VTKGRSSSAKAAAAPAGPASAGPAAKVRAARYGAHFVTCLADTLFPQVGRAAVALLVPLIRR
jgi:hypothetical protein